MNLPAHIITCSPPSMNLPVHGTTSPDPSIASLLNATPTQVIVCSIIAWRNPKRRQAKPVQTAWRNLLTARRQTFPRPTMLQTPPSGAYPATKCHAVQRPLPLFLSLGGYQQAARRYTKGTQMCWFYNLDCSKVYCAFAFQDLLIFQPSHHHFNFLYLIHKFFYSHHLIHQNLPSSIIVQSNLKKTA